MKKEIEIKLKVKSHKPVLDFLNKNGEFVSEKSQKDEYYMPIHRNFIEAKPIKEWFRLRKDEDGVSLNYKNWQYHDDGKAYHCDEQEVKIDGEDEIKEILKALDFKPLVTVDKVRKTFIYNRYEIALDEVKDLGSFIEVECKIQPNEEFDSKLITDDMERLIKDMGCEITERTFKGYPFQLLINKYQISVD